MTFFNGLNLRRILWGLRSLWTKKKMEEREGLAYNDSYLFRVKLYYQVLSCVNDLLQILLQTTAVSYLLWYLVVCDPPHTTWQHKTLKYTKKF